MTDTPPSVNAFALTAEAKQKTLGNIDRCCSLFYVAMASIYNVAQSAMVDAHAFLRLHPAYRQEVKRSAKKALLAYERLDKALQQTLGDRYQLWLDLSDNVDDEMRSHIQTLRLSFDAWLLRYNVQEHALLAHMETALTIVRMAQQTFGILFDKFDEQIHVNLRPLFAGADFRDVLFWWQRATDTLIKMYQPKEHINFNQSKDINLAFEIIAKKLTDEHIFNRASEQALKQNPDKWHLLDEEDRMRLKKGMPLS